MGRSGHQWSLDSRAWVARFRLDQEFPRFDVRKARVASDGRVMTGEVAVAVDDEQLLEVFDRALAEVYGYLLHRCRVKALAEDLVSETFLGALDSIRRGYGGEVTVAWLIGIARHKLADHWRREEREQRHLMAVGAVPPDPDLALQVEPELGIEVLGLLSP